MEITRIEFESYSRFGMITEAYEEKLVLRPGSISFEHRPEVLKYDEVPVPDWNQPARWSYKANSPKFEELFSSITNMVRPLLGQQTFACDAGGLTIRAAFEDKSKQEFIGFVHCSEAEPIMKALTAAIPPLEQMPQMLAAYSDEEEMQHQPG